MYSYSEYTTRRGFVTVGLSPALDLILRQPGLGGSLFRDGFPGQSINPSKWTITDTESKLRVLGSRLVCVGGKGTPAWNDPRLSSAVAVAAAAGLTLEWELTRTGSGSGGGMQAGFDGSNPITQSLSAGWALSSSGVLQAFPSDAQQRSFITLTQGVSYRFRIVLKNGGALWYYSTNGGVTWNLAWEEASGNTGPLYYGYLEHSIPFTSDCIRIFQSSVKAAVVTDTFTRADNALTLGSAESGQAWTAVAGTWGISSNKAYCVGDMDTETAVLESGIADGIVDCTVSGTLASGTDFRIPHVLVRYLDANNFLRVFYGAGNVKLQKSDGGVTSDLAVTALAALDGTDYAIRIAMVGNSVKVYVDGTERISYTLAGGDTKYNAYTKVGMRLRKSGSPATAARWDNLAVQGGLP